VRQRPSPVCFGRSGVCRPKPQRLAAFKAATSALIGKHRGMSWHIDLAPLRKKGLRQRSASMPRRQGRPAWPRLAKRVYGVSRAPRPRQACSHARAGGNTLASPVTSCPMSEEPSKPVAENRVLGRLPTLRWRPLEGPVLRTRCRGTGIRVGLSLPPPFQSRLGALQDVADPSPVR